MNRVVAGLAILMALLFASVSFEEPEFLLIHCFEGAIYIVVVVLLYYSREEWAYPLGMILPLVWIILSYATGRLSAGVVQAGMLVGRREEISNLTSLLAVALTIAGLAMVVASAYYYRKEIHGSPSGGPKNFGLAALIAVAYYAVLVLWFTAAVS